jgi:hypothetical protein
MIRKHSLSGMLVVLLFAGVLPAQARIAIDVAADYGAVPDDSADDAPAFLNALTALKNAGGGTLNIPAGEFLFLSQVALSVSDWRITIQGDLLGRTELAVDNTNGLFKLTHSARNPQVNIYDLRITALREGAGTAIEVTGPPGGVQEKRVVTLNNIQICGQDDGPEYFNKGIVINGLYRPLIEECSVTRTTSTDMSDSSPNFLTEVGIDITDCYAPVLENCAVTGADTAYYYSTTNSPEDGALRESTADYCRTGLRYFFDNGTSQREETLWINDSDIRARDAGVEVKGRRICNIARNTFRRLSDSHALNDVTLESVTLGCVMDNTFEGTLDSGRKNVSVLDSKSNYIIIINNSLSGDSGSALDIHPDAQNILTQ